MRNFLIVVLLLGALPAVAAEGVPSHVGISNQSTITVIPSGSQPILPANSNRDYLLIQNQGLSTVYLKMDSTQSGDQGIALTAGSSWEPKPAPINLIYGKSATGTGNVTLYILEGIK